MKNPQMRVAALMLTDGLGSVLGLHAQAQTVSNPRRKSGGDDNSGCR
jgi:hypothetical protein